MSLDFFLSGVCELWVTKINIGFQIENTLKDFFRRQRILTIKQKTPQESLSCCLEFFKVETFHRFNCGSPFNFKKVLKNKNNLLSKNIKCSIFILQQQCLSLIIKKIQTCLFFTVCICEFFSLRHCKVVKVSVNHVILVIHVTKSGKENILFQYSRQL